MGERPLPALAWLKRRLPVAAWRAAVAEPQAQGHTVFHKAAQRGRVSALAWLLREARAAGADLASALAADASGRPPSAVAGAAGFPESAALLAAAEADVRLDRRKRRRLAGLAGVAGVAALAAVALYRQR